MNLDDNDGLDLGWIFFMCPDTKSIRYISEKGNAAPGNPWKSLRKAVRHAELVMNSTAGIPNDEARAGAHGCRKSYMSKSGLNVRRVFKKFGIADLAKASFRVCIRCDGRLSVVWYRGGRSGNDGR
ncbi:hypothetical protein AKJ16_DCAP08880 [Drosera capensis]